MVDLSFFISLSFWAYQSIHYILQQMNIVKDRSGCYTGDPSTCINEEYYIRIEGEQQQMFITDIGS